MHNEIMNEEQAKTFFEYVTERPVLVIDGKNVLFQYLAVEPTAAANTMILSVAAVAERFGVATSDIHICWEATDNFRFAIYPAYKGTRVEDDLTREGIVQMARVVEILKHTPIAQWQGRGGEGDDVVATLARRLHALGRNVTVWSTDGDMRQLVCPKLKVVAVNVNKDKESGRRTDQVYDEAGVIQRTGVPPRLVTAQKSLVGDSGDNVLGVPFVGEKTAASILMWYDATLGSEFTPLEVLEYVISRAQEAVEKYTEVETREVPKAKKRDASREVESFFGMTQRIAASIADHADRVRLALDLVTLRDIEIWNSRGPHDIVAFQSYVKSVGAWPLLSDRVSNVLFGTE